MTRLVNTGILQPPIHLENRFEALMNVDEESKNVTKLGSNQPAANIATNRRSRSSRQRHSAQSAAEPRTLIVGDSIIRNISSRTITTCCFTQATVSDVNKELQNIVMKHKTANRVINHVGKNDIRKGQSELLKQDFSELFETLQRLEVQSFISGPLLARGTNMFSRLLGLNTWLQRTCSTKGVNFIDNFNICHIQYLYTSLLSGTFPNSLKTAVVKPLLKKRNLDNTMLSNYRPISNLPFIGKIIEKIVFNQLNNYLNSNEYLDNFQSGFRVHHSTETALIKLINDIRFNSDFGKISVLVLLDLCAAFDTVDHNILLERLENWVGLSGMALKWFRSYLEGRGYYVSIGEHYLQMTIAPLTPSANALMKLSVGCAKTFKTVNREYLFWM